jgi:S1-C subfamily serine protease
VRAQGSGFLVDATGVFVTNFHVIDRATTVMAKLADGREFAVTGIVALKPDLDLAILKIDAQGLPVVTLGDSETAKVGQRVVAIGSPLGFENTVSDGLISAIRESGPGGKVFQITSPVSPGSSGGVLMNTEGKVIGITFAQVTEAQNLNFAIPINQVKPLIRDEPVVAFSPGALVPRAEDTECPVIGNKMSGIYHVSGGQFYGQMRASQHRVCFKTEEEAGRAGFRRSLR